MAVGVFLVGRRAPRERHRVNCEHVITPRQSLGRARRASSPPRYCWYLPRNTHTSSEASVERRRMAFILHLRFVCVRATWLAPFYSGRNCMHSNIWEPYFNSHRSQRFRKTSRTFFHSGLKHGIQASQVAGLLQPRLTVETAHQRTTDRPFAISALHAIQKRAMHSEGEQSAMASEGAHPGPCQ